MYTAFFDDSGTHPDSEIAVAACYVGANEQWERHASDWNRAKVLEKFNVFGMADVLGGGGEFRFWPSGKRIQVIRRLIRLTTLRASIGFSFAVIKKEYDATVPSRLRDVAGRHHYTFMVRSCLKSVHDWREQYNVSAPIRYVFDRMGKGKGEIETVLTRLIEDGEGEPFGLSLGGFGFESKTCEPGLQAVDILAHETYRMMRDRSDRSAGRFASQRNYMRELSEGPLQCLYWDVDELVSYAKRTGAALDQVGWGQPLTNRQRRTSKN
jgi:hypothetical protein